MSTTTSSDFLCDSRSGNGCAGLVPTNPQYFSSTRILPESGRMQFEGTAQLTREYLAPGAPINAPFATASIKQDK